MSGRLTLTKNDVAGVVVCVPPVVSMVPPPVATTLVLAPQPRNGIGDGVTLIGMGVVTVGGVSVPRTLLRVTKPVCPTASVTAIGRLSKHPPKVVTVKPPPLVATEVWDSNMNCGNELDTV